MCPLWKKPKVKGVSMQTFILSCLVKKKLLEDMPFPYNCSLSLSHTHTHFHREGRHIQLHFKFDSHTPIQESWIRNQDQDRGLMGSFSLCTHLQSVHASKLQSSSNSLFCLHSNTNPKQLCFSNKTSNSKIKLTLCLSSPKDAATDNNPPGDNNIQSNFCIIEGPETVQDFVQMEMQEIHDNIKSRRSKNFLLMEEVRRLRVQQRIKSVKTVDERHEEENELPNITSSIPFLPHVTLQQLYLTSFSFISGIIVLGGLVAPILELKLGLGGTSYEDFIRNMHLPMQLSQVDPIVASFSGGAVGVISALMLLEVNNVKQQEKRRCKYCHGTGYLSCANCSASGMCLSIEPISVTNPSSRPLLAPTTRMCLNCSGSGKVMCPTCLCTGMMMASEHDPRIDPFDLN